LRISSRLPWLVLCGGPLWLCSYGALGQTPIDVRVTGSRNTRVTINVDNRPPQTVVNPDPNWTDQMLDRFAKQAAAAAASGQEATEQVRKALERASALSSAERKKITASLLQEVLSALTQAQNELNSQIATVGEQQAAQLHQKLEENQQLAAEHSQKQVELLQGFGNDLQLLQQTNAEGQLLLQQLLSGVSELGAFEGKRRAAEHGFSIMLGGDVQWLPTEPDALEPLSLSVSLSTRWHWWPWELEAAIWYIIASSQLKGGYLSPLQDELLLEEPVRRSGWGLELTPRFAFPLTNALTLAIGPKFGGGRVSYSKREQESDWYAYLGPALAIDLRLHPSHGFRFDLNGLWLISVPTPLRRYEGVGASYESLRKGGGELRVGFGYGFIL
jgi:hypothetical protein